MAGITQTHLPEDSLLYALAKKAGAHADCFETTVACNVDPPSAFQRFVYLFFDSPVFRLERVILGLLGKAKRDQCDPVALAKGDINTFAAWRVHQRTQTEIVMVVPNTAIRTWLSVTKEGETARLRFGSSILPEDGKAAPSWIYRVTLRGHLLYSRILLRAAARDWTRGKVL